MFLIVNVRVSPGLRFGSPVSPMFAASLTLFPPAPTNTGGSFPNVTGNLSNGDAVFSTEAVLYQDQAGAAEAMAEARGAASRCPPGPVAGPTPTDPQLRWRVRGDTDLGGGRPSGLDRLGLTVQASEAGSPAESEVLVFLRRGRLLLGLYFVQAAGPQAQIDGASTIASTVRTFEDRVEAVPAADLG